MTHRSNPLHNQLSFAESDRLDRYIAKAEKEADHEADYTAEPKGRGPLKKIVLLVIVVVLGIFLMRGLNNSLQYPVNFISEITNINGPSADLLTRMGDRMEEMGYTGLSEDDLRALRSEGVSATYISNVRSLGYEDLTLDDAVRMANADASSAFIAMMIELGYSLDVDEIVRLRNAGITANYTSKIHDLGYRDVTIDQLIRMDRIGVTPELVTRLHEERGENIPLEDVIRYRISNQ